MFESLEIRKAANGFVMVVNTEDDSKVESFMPYVEATTAQKLGSNNTYNRRYSLITLLGLEDEDDDGNVASAPVHKKKVAVDDDF